MNKALVVILAAVMLDAIGIGLIFPILPALLREVGHTSDISILLGVMLALYSACQFLFSPILGVLSDRFGRRPVLL
ncbi:MAG: MFS transporter, partial [Hyphomicrobiales bacterium]